MSYPLTLSWVLHDVGFEYLPTETQSVYFLLELSVYKTICMSACPWGSKPVKLPLVYEGRCNCNKLLVYLLFFTEHIKTFNF